MTKFVSDAEQKTPAVFASLSVKNFNNILVQSPSLGYPETCFFFGNLPVFGLCTWRLAGVLKSSTFAKKRERRKGNRQNGKQHADTAEVTRTALFCTYSVLCV